MSNTTNQMVITELAHAISPRIEEWYGDGAVLDVDAFALRTYPYSFFVEFPVKTSSGTQMLLAKIHRKPMVQTLADALAVEKLHQLARNEYDVSQKIWHAFEEEGTGDCEVVRYLDYCKEWNALLMRQVKGRMLKKYLLHPSIALRSAASMERLQAFLILAARWLQIFHRRVSGLQVIPFPKEDVSVLIEDVLGKLHTHSDGQVDIDPYRIALNRALEDIGLLSVPVGLLHADFQFSNILVTSEGKVCVLDYSLTHYGSTYFDLATLLIDPETRKAQILTNGRFVSSDYLRACQRSILDTYFGNEPYHQNVLHFYCALAILNKWSADEKEFSNSRQTIPTLLFSRVTRRYYVELLLRYLPFQ